MIRFIRTDSEERGARYTVKKLPILLGRAPDADLRLDPHRDLDASARHAEIFLHEGGLFIRDLGSRNGSYLNGRRLSGHARIRSGDEIELGYGGPRFRITVEIEGLIDPSAELDPPRDQGGNVGAVGDPKVDEFAETIAFAAEGAHTAGRGEDAIESSRREETVEADEGEDTLLMDGPIRDALIEKARSASASQRATEASLARSETAETLLVEAIKEREMIAQLERENRRLRIKTLVLSVLLGVSIILSWLYFSR